MLLFLDEFLDICECDCEWLCDGLDSPSALIVSWLGTGWMDPKINWQFGLLSSEIIAEIIGWWLPDFLLSKLSWPRCELNECSLSVRPWILSTKLCFDASGVVKSRGVVILLMLGMDPIDHINENEWFWLFFK